MTDLRKKIVAIATVFTVLLGIAGPAMAATAAELQASIDALMAELADLKAELAELTGEVVTECCSFTRNLYPEMSGADVKCLQEYLNDAGYTLAASGAGSPGNETTYFGPLTRAAVKAWQDANGVVYGVWWGYFGPLSQAKYDDVCVAEEVEEEEAVEEEEEAVAPAEGTYTVALSAIPADATVNAGLDIPVYGIDITAYGSDITIGRLDLQMTATNAVTAVAYNPGTFVAAISVYDGTTLVLKKTITSADVTLDAAGLWYARLTGINFVIPVGTTKTLTVKIDTFTDFDQNRTFTVNVYGNGIRGTDTLGINTFAALATVRTFTFQRAGQATLTGAVSTNNPLSANFETDATDGVKEVTLLIFNLKSTIGDSTLTKLAVNMASGAASEILPTIIYLKDGDTVLASANPSSGIGTFENFKLVIVLNATKELKVTGDFPAPGSAEPASNNNQAVASIPGTSASCQFMRADGAIVQTTIAAAIQGNRMYLWTQGLQATLVSATNVVTADGLGHGDATGIIKFKVEPFGGTLTQFAFATNASGAADEVTVLAITAAGAVYATGRSATIVTYLDGNTPDGGSADVTITIIVTDDGTTNPGLIRFEIQDICWEVGGAAVAEVNQRWGLTSFITPWANLK